MNQIFDLIKENKKKVVIIGAILVLLLVLLAFGNRGNSGGDYFNTLTSLSNEEQYNGTVDLNVGGKNIHFDVLKNNNNFAVSMNVPGSESSYNDIIVKQDGTIYLNTSSISSGNGLVAVRETQQSEDTVDFMSTITSALSSAELTQTIDSDGNAVLSVGGTDEWATFFSAINTAITENIDSISSGYKEKDAVKTLLTEIAKSAKAAAETNTVANTISASITTENEENIRKYKGSFEFTADFLALPEFINPDDFDSNQLKITGEIEITVGEASTAKPVGAVHDANSQNIVQFFISLWNDIFSKEEYVSLNEVTVTNSSVHNKYDLGEIIEESTFSFNKDGIESAEWIISSTNSEIINAYADKYAAGKKPIYNESTGVYNLILYASENALVSLNKLGTTPKAFGEYLKTAKGGEIIV